MSGEISLTGMVLPVGGIQKKVLAASQQQITHIILPKDNEVDVEDVRKKRNVEGLQFYFVEHVLEILEILFVPVETLLVKMNPKL